MPYEGDSGLSFCQRCHRCSICRSAFTQRARPAQVLAVAKDQNGCRFLQRKFDEGGAAAIGAVLPEVLEHLIELMMDPFGNYLIQKLLDRCSEDQRLAVLKKAAEKRELVQVALNTHGTRAVQKLIETLTSREQVCARGCCAALCLPRLVWLAWPRAASGRPLSGRMSNSFSARYAVLPPTLRPCVLLVKSCRVGRHCLCIDASSEMPAAGVRAGTQAHDPTLHRTPEPVGVELREIAAGLGCTVISQLSRDLSCRWRWLRTRCAGGWFRSSAT